MEFEAQLRGGRTEVTQMTPKKFGEIIRELGFYRDLDIKEINRRYEFDKAKIVEEYKAANDGDDPWRHFGDA
jgi:hypothetical protein